MARDNSRDSQNQKWMGNGWTQYQKLVLAELERHSKQLEALNSQLNKQMSDLQVEIATLKVKSGVWGLLGGLIPVLVFVVIELVGRRN